jgi:hypothetical protein
MRLSSFEDGDLGPGGAFISRWGGDPIRYDISPQEHFFIPPSAFEDLKRLGEGPHRPGYVAKARMPTQGPASAQQLQATKDIKNGDSFLEVSLLTYEPCFDLDREEWYIDVNLRPSLATDPFVPGSGTLSRKRDLPRLERVEARYPLDATPPDAGSRAVL